MIYCDNVRVIYLFNNSVQRKRTKHIKMDIHFVLEKVTYGHEQILHVISYYQIADILIKDLSLILFQYF